MFRSKGLVPVLLTKKQAAKATSLCIFTSRTSVAHGHQHCFLTYAYNRGPDEAQVARAKVLTEDLLLVVRSEHTKMAAALHQQQIELHQAQAQYAAYSAMAVGAAPLIVIQLFALQHSVRDSLHKFIFFRC